MAQHRYADGDTVSAPVLIKKYGNRRLYDTGESRYITLEELSRKIHDGADVRVIDAKTGDDLTQGTLTQIIVEGRGAARMLPVPLLTQLIRLGDDALAEFFGRYVTDALAVYLDVKRGASAMARYNPFATMPFATGDALARLWMSSPFGTSRTAQVSPAWSPPAAEPAEPSPDHRAEPAPAEAPEPRSDELAALRRELEELKRSVLQRDESDEPTPPQRRRTRKRKPR